MSKNKIQKLYYSIREVSEMTGVKPHVLRFWEKEFSMLRPKRGRSGNRSYRERDIKIIQAIKELHYDQKYTIQGALEQLKKDRSLWEEQPLNDPTEDPVQAPGEVVADLRAMLLELKALVNGRG